MLFLAKIEYFIKEIIRNWDLMFLIFLSFKVVEIKKIVNSISSILFVTIL